MNNKTDNVTGGLILIAIGALVLFFKNVEVILPEIADILFLPTLGALFITAALISRKVGLLIPGGILLGIGSAAFLNENPLGWFFLNDINDGATFFFCFAAGWLTIPFFSTFISREIQWWALIPAGIMALIGGAVGFGGLFLTVLELLGNGWPVILIAVGLWSLVETMTKRPSHTDA